MKTSVSRSTLAALTAATLALPVAAQDMQGQVKCAPSVMAKCGSKCGAKCSSKKMAKCGARKCAPKCAPKCGPKCAPKH